MKRAGPGGKGHAFNPFSQKSLQAVQEHLEPVLSEFPIRAQFHDSWEYNSSARVRLNNTDVATLIGPSFKTRLENVKPPGNLLEIQVTNLAANRIRDLDRRNVRWQIFEDINFASRQYESFDASDWPVAPSGLLGPVRLRRLG